VKFNARPAIAELLISLDTMKTNEPINRKEGKADQADLEKENAASFRGAINLLRQHQQKKLRFTKNLAGVS
jgi:hypothetical protein